MNDNIAPIFQRNKVKATIESAKELLSEKKTPDGLTKSTSSIYWKWETKYPWAYFNHSKNRLFCKTFSLVNTMNTRVNFSLIMKIHQREILNVISKGTIAHQMVAGAETQSNASRDRNRRLIGKFIKTTYFLTRKKWAVKFNFKDVIDFLDDIGDPDIKYHLRNAPQNLTYTSTFAVEEFLKLIGKSLSTHTVA